MNNVNEKIQSGKPTVVDVRTPPEFAGGHVAGSINIPLQEVPARLEELKNLENIVVCCASGNRSHLATIFLQQNGIACENGGAWTEVNAHLK